LREFNKVWVWVLWNRNFKFVSIYHTVTGRFLWYLAKWLTPTTFWQTSGYGSGLIWNPDSNPRSLLLEILALAEVCDLWAQSSSVYRVFEQ